MGDGTPGNPGKRNDFEMAVAYLLPKDPVTNKVAKGPNKRGVSKISDLTSSNGNDGNLKKGMGKTGVHLCCHSAKSFRQLTTEQKKELIEWRKKNKDDSLDQSGKKKKLGSGSSYLSQGLPEAEPLVQTQIVIVRME